MTHYPAKQKLTSDHKLNPEPTTKFTEKLTAETVHGHAPIHNRSKNPRTNIGTDGGENTFSDKRPHLSA